MLEVLVGVGSGAGAAVGLFAFGLSVTRSSRLRRRAQFLRDALDMLDHDLSPAAHTARQITLDMHRAQTAEVIARQLTPIRRVAGPWLVWLVVAAVFAQMGVLTADFLWRVRTRDFTRYLTEVLAGDPTALFITPLVALTMLPLIHRIYILALEHRLRTAAAFYSGRRVTSPLPFMEHHPLLIWGDSEGRRSGWVEWAWSLVPGLLALTMGFLVGEFWWIETRPDSSPKQRAELVNSQGVLPIVLAFTVACLMAATVKLVMRTRSRLRKLAIPETFPQSGAGRRSQVPRMRPKSLAHPGSRQVEKLKRNNLK